MVSIIGNKFSTLVLVLSLLIPILNRASVSDVRAWYSDSNKTSALASTKSGLHPATQEETDGRVQDNLIALYTFEEGSGLIVKDVSGVGEPIDLNIKNPEAVEWIDGGVVIKKETIISSASAATKVIDAAKASNEITIEAWIKPANTTQDGPARIVTLSQSPTKRNFTMAQGLWGDQPPDLYDVRLRSTTTTLSGMPSLSSDAGSLTAELTHVVFTRNTAGLATTYINGVKAASHNVNGKFSNWDNNYQLALANEITNNRPWLGEYYLVALYNRALDANEISQNFAAGPDDSEIPEPTPDPAETPTAEPTATSTAEPTSSPTADPLPSGISLQVEAPTTITTGETTLVSIKAKNVKPDGIYGVQLELHFNPAMISADNVQVHPDLNYVLRANADNTSGKVTLVASRQGKVDGLTGEVTLMTFDITAADVTGDVTLTFANEKLSDPAAAHLDVTTEAKIITIEDDSTEPTPEPTGEPTQQPTNTPSPTPTGTTTPEPTTEPTVEPTPTSTTEPTPEPTSEPGNALIFGQVLLNGRAEDNWSGASVTVAGTTLSTITDLDGSFVINNIPTDTDLSIVADAPAYLSAVCTNPTIIAPETELQAVTLLSGDITDDELVDVADATAVGLQFGQTGSGLTADINLDQIIDIFDLVLVSTNFGQEGPQEWVCQ
ncbi:MAG: hypothetical protein KDJ52_23135 [Anaerolineae bacterium]|nr:hypothetical protein [Anaerolineae bacterium]